MKRRQHLLVVTLGLAVLAPSVAAVQAPPTPLVFHSQVEAIYVDAFVTQGGAPVSGLRASDFELRDNGVRQRLELISTESQPLLAVLVFDTSNSVAGEKLDGLRAAGEAFLDGLRPADQAALVAFSEDVTWLHAPTQNKTDVRRALGELRASGATSVFDALYAGLTLPDTGFRPLVVLFTDGEDNSSWLGERQIRVMAERANALVHVVGWRPPATRSPRGDWVRPPEAQYERTLREIAELAGGRFWDADSPSRLQQAFGDIAEAMSQRYVLRYEAAGVEREGWHRIEARLSGRRGDVHVRRGYWVRPEAGEQTQFREPSRTPR